jgi:hypothetical protein
MSDYIVNKKNLLNQRGVLIESDAGFISPIDSRNTPFINEIKKLDSGVRISNDEPLVVYVVLQKYAVKNRNGRIYPENILRREVEKYQQVIRERRAVGECVPAGTEIFTKNGWVDIKDVSIGDDVYTLNLDTNQIEIQKVYDTIKKHYDDDLVHIYNKGTLDMKLTKNHKMVLWDRNNKPYEMTAIEFYDSMIKGDSRLSHSKINYGGNWVGVNDEYFILPNTDIKINIHDWAAFLGIFLAEGHTSGSKGGKIDNRVVITQKKEMTKRMVIDLLDRLPFNYHCYGDRQFVINSKDLHNHLSPLGNSYGKYIPEYAKNWSKEVLNTLLTWMLVGDGVNRHNNKGVLMREYYTTSPKLAEDVFEVMLKLGSGAKIRTRLQKDRYIYDEINEDVEIDNGDGTISLIKNKVKRPRLIKKENSKLLYIVAEKTTSSVTLDKRFTNVELEKFNDNVYCVSVPNKTWLMRYNNQVAWTHNCDHPETSIIAADRISHNILETWWEGKTLMGKMEVLMSPGYINYGIVSTKGDEVANLLRNNIMIGVSSRGLGSLREVSGDLIVQDDFEIICWDVVTAPSTPGSWIFGEKSEARPFVESVEGKNNLLIDGLDKFLLD